MGFTPNYNIEYPDPAQKVAELPAALKRSALSVEAALAAASIPPINSVVGPLANEFDNAGFDIAQRGRNAFTAVGYTADRIHLLSRTAATITYNELAAGRDVTFGCQIAATAAVNSSKQVQPYESYLVKRWRGQQRTFAVYVEGSVSTAAVTIAVEVGTVADSVNGGSWSTVGTVTVTPTLSGMWAKVTVTVPANAVGLRLAVSTSNNPNGSTITWSMPMWVKGTLMPNWQPKHPSISAELLNCNRHYVRQAASQAYSPFGTLVIYSSAAADLYLQLPASLRSAPASIETSGAFMSWSGSSPAIAPTGFTLGPNSTLTVANLAVTGTGGVGGLATLRANNSLGAYIGVSAEL